MIWDLVMTNEDDADLIGGGGALVEEAKPKLRRPPQSKVLLLNDDYTPMEFVVDILERFFFMDRTKATQIMLAIHTRGKAVCGIYPKDIAETKAAAVNNYSRENDHPLLCETEPLDESED